MDQEQMVDNFDESQEDALMATRLATAANLESRANRAQRTEREKNCQFLLLGVLLASPSLLDDVEASDCLDRSIGATVEHLQRFKTDRSAVSERESVLRWLESQAGVVVASEEKLPDAVMRTVRENCHRVKLSALLQSLVLQSANHTCSDGAFISQVKERIAAV